MTMNKPRLWAAVLAFLIVGMNGCDSSSNEPVAPMVSGNTEGTAVYERQCLACHGADGVGRPGIFPPLMGNVASLAMRDGGREYLIQVVMNGVGGRIEVNGETYRGAMPGFGRLSDAEIAAVLNHITRSGAGEAPDEPAVSVFTADEIAAGRDRGLRPGEVRALRPEAEE